MASPRIRSMVRRSAPSPPGSSRPSPGNGPRRGHPLRRGPRGGGGGMSNLAKKPADNAVTQRIYRLLLPEAVLSPPICWLGEGFCGSSLEQQFKPYVYPEPGKSEVKMFYRYGGSYIGTMTDTNRFVRMYQSPKLQI